MTELPPGWASITLGEISTSIKNGIFVSRPGTEPNGVPILRISSVRQLHLNHEDVRYSGLSAEELEDKDALIHPGDLLFTRYSGSREYVGVCAVATGQPPQLTYPDKIIRVRVDTRAALPKFVALVFAWHRTREFIESVLRTTAGQVGIAGKDLARTPFPLPPLAEQRRIVATLEDHLSRLDTGSSSISHAQRRSALLVSSIRNAVVNDSEAEQKPLGELIIRIEAGKSFAAESRPAAPDEWGIIKVSAMTWGEFRAQENKAVPPGRSIDPRFEIKPGDILLSRANTEQYVGASVLVRHTRPKLLLSDKSLRIVPRDDIDREWLIQVLSSPLVRKQIAARATGTKDAMRNISQDALKEIKIPYVALEKQREIAARIRDLLDSIFHLDTQIKRAKEKEKSLRRSLLEAAFTGQLVPQNPKDEPASVLLERIKAERAAQGKPKRARRATAKTLKTTTRPVQESLL